MRVTAGRATHDVDFVEHRLQPGSLLWIRPGQVQRFSRDAPAGDLVIFEADFLIPGTQAAQIATRRRLGSGTAGVQSTAPAVGRALRELEREYAAAVAGSQITVAQTETLRHLLSILVLRLVPDAVERSPAPAAKQNEDFRDLLERDFAVAHGVDHYARELGYSVRTLNRATQVAAGETPKQAIARRIALEAQRLLVHTDRPVAVVARDLGFRDASNFATFFGRQTAETPTGFRRRHRGSGAIRGEARPVR